MQKGLYRDLNWLEERVRSWEDGHEDEPPNLLRLRLLVSAQLREILNSEERRRPLTKEEKEMSLSLDRMKEENEEAIKNLRQTIESMEQSIEVKKAELERRLGVAAALAVKSKEVPAELPKFNAERAREMIEQRR